MKAKQGIHLVICEGKDDQLVMEALATHAGIREQLEFHGFAEKGTLKGYLRALAKSPDFTRGAIDSILVTQDADENFQARWESVRDAVSSAFGLGLSCPGVWERPEGGPKIAAWINPGSGSKGMLETMLLDAARETHSEIFPCIDNFVDCINRVSGNRLHEKSRFYIWTIVAQGAGPQDRLSLKRALEHLPPNWDAEAFSGLRGVLEAALMEER
jgi:hypothetical protein